MIRDHSLQHSAATRAEIDRESRELFAAGDDRARYQRTHWMAVEINLAAELRRSLP